MDKGWIKLYRKLLDNDELMADHNALVLFIFVLLHSERNGTCRVSRYNTSTILNMKPSTYRNALARLSDNNYFGGHLLDTSGGNKYTLVSIVNWDKYQDTKEVKTHNRGQQKDTITRKKKQEVNTTVNLVDEKLLKFLSRQDKITNAEGYLAWLKGQVSPKNLIRLLDIEFYRWTEYIDLWKKGAKK